MVYPVHQWTGGGRRDLPAGLGKMLRIGKNAAGVRSVLHYFLRVRLAEIQSASFVLLRLLFNIVNEMGDFPGFGYGVCGDVGCFDQRIIPPIESAC